MKTLSLVSVCALLVAGCSSVPTAVDRGLIHASSYSLLPSKAPATATVNERRQQVHQEIQAAIAKQLGEKGLEPAASGGDLQVGYMVIVADNATTATYDEYFGYGPDAAVLSDKAHKMLAKSNSRERFEIGAIVIDIIRASDSKLLYRQVAHMDVKKVNPANRVEAINSLVASSLANLRVTP